MEEVQLVLERAIGLIGEVAESGMKLKDDTEAYQRPSRWYSTSKRVPPGDLRRFPGGVCMTRN